MFFLTLLYTGLALLSLYLLWRRRTASHRYSRDQFLSRFHEFTPPADWVSIDSFRKHLIERKAKTEKVRVKSLSKGQPIILPEDKENLQPLLHQNIQTEEGSKLDPGVPEFVPVFLNPEAPAFTPPN